MSTRRMMLALLLCMGATGCAAPYQPISASSIAGRGGYAELDPGNRVYEIRYWAPNAEGGMPKRAPAYDFALYRGAELARPQQFKGFSVLKASSTFINDYNNTKSEITIALTNQSGAGVYDADAVINGVRAEFPEFFK